MKIGARSTIVVFTLVFLGVFFISACEKNEWAKTQKTNTVEAYKVFLEKYPNGKFAAEASASIENIKWQEAEKASTTEAYEEFLKTYPESANAAIASERIAALKEQKLMAMEKEAADNLVAIRTALENYGAKQKMAKKKALYIACKPSPPEGGTDARPDPWSDAGGFSELGFQPSDLVLYQYEVAVDKSGKSYIATATGDLDENGIPVKFTVSSDDPTPVKSLQEEH